MSNRRYTDLHGRGEPPFPRWDHTPRHDEPAHGYFLRIAALNNQPSAAATASSFGLNGRSLGPSECLDFAMSFPIEGKERLEFVTPKVTDATVTMAGETFRRRNWSIDKRYFCPGCLAEDAYHRFFWDIVAFRHCPFHDQPLRCVDPAGREVPWWSPSFTHSPFGNPIAEFRKRASSARPSIESYVLGRFGLLESFPLPILDDLATLANVFSTVELAGKLALGGRGKKPPSLSALGKQATYRAGFDLLYKGPDEINRALTDLAVRKDETAYNAEGSLKKLFGWVYSAARYTQDVSHVFVDCMVGVAAIQVGLPSRISDLREVKARTQLVDVADLSNELDISIRAIRKIAAAMGIRENCSRPYTAFTEEEARVVRNTVAELIGRDEAARLLDVSRPFFDSLVHHGLVPPLIRLQSGEDCRFRPQDIASFASPLIQRARRLDTEGFVGRALNKTRRSSQRSSQTSPARLVQQVIDGTIPILGRCGESFGSILIPTQVKQKTARTPLNRASDETSGIGMLDAAARLGVDHSAIVGLRELGFLTNSSSHTKLLDRNSFDIFCATYCTSRHYAPILKCRVQQVPRRLSDLGIEVLRLDRGRGGINFVNRAEARCILQITIDPDTRPTDTRNTFLSGLIDHVRKTTTFRLSSQTDGITFRTGRGSFSLFMTIDWKHRALQIGPRYSSRKSPQSISDLLQRKPEIEAVFSRELTWGRDDNWLRVYTQVNNLAFESLDCWPDIYSQISGVFHEFKRHFEPPQHRY